MIPYDDLVAALQTWRTRQGLPVATPAPGSGPRTGHAAPAAPAQRTSPPTSPPPAPGSMAGRQPALTDHVIEAHDEVHEVPEELHEEVHEVEEGAYESEGSDFAMSFAGDGHKGHVTGVNGDDGGETMLGHDPNVEPDPPSDLTDPGAAQRNGRDDW